MTQEKELSVATNALVLTSILCKTSEKRFFKKKIENLQINQKWKKILSTLTKQQIVQSLQDITVSIFTGKM